MLKYWKTISFFIITIVIILLFTDIYVVILEDLIDNRAVYIKEVCPGDEFTMKWTHSVELQPWEETFKIDKNYNIILDRTRFKAFGAGVPDDTGNKAEVKDGYVIFSGIDRKVPDLQYGISHFAKHTFYFQDKELKLYQTVEDGNPIKIYIDRLNILKYFTKKLL